MTLLDVALAEKMLSEILSEKRFIHSINVAKMAQMLAKKYHFDEPTAFYAGLIHDAAKNMSYEEQITLIGEDIKITSSEKKIEKLLHSPAGCAFAKKNLGVKNKEILNAVRYHTLGRPNMSLLEKIIYLADYVEEGRSFRGIKTLRKLAFKDLNRAILKATDYTIVHLMTRNREIATEIIDVRNYYLAQIKFKT